MSSNLETLRPLVPFHAGSPMMVSGPTGSGKTVWIHRLLRGDMFTQNVSSVLYCYGVYQNYFEEIMKSVSEVTFLEGLPSKDRVEKLSDGRFHVIVLDDLMEQIVKSIEIQNLFTKYCHHFNISAIFISQNVFAQGPCARTININTHVLVLFANKRDESQAMNLAKQLYPGRSKLFLQAFEDATSKPFGYLVVDCDPKSSRYLKLRTNIFPGEDTICYIPT